jgi:hypothetical protein
MIIDAKFVINNIIDSIQVISFTKFGILIISSKLVVQFQ